MTESIRHRFPRVNQSCQYHRIYINAVVLAAARAQAPLYLAKCFS